MNNIKKYIASTFVVIIIIAFSSYSTKDNSLSYTINNDELINASIENLFNKFLNEENKNSKLREITITEVNTVNDLYTLTFLVKKDNNLHHGFFAASLTDKGNNYIFNDIESAKVTTKEPISYFGYSGSTNDKLKQRLQIFTGYINSKDIRKIYFNYSDARTSVIVLSDNQTTFTEIQIGNSNLESIIAISKNGQIIFEKNYDY